jgi:hypothetical protein
MAKDLSTAEVVSQTKTPYAVRCWRHGQVFLTAAGYDRQMDRPDARWLCPLCGEEACFDDANYEAAMEEEENEEDRS